MQSKKSFVLNILKFIKNFERQFSYILQNSIWLLAEKFNRAILGLLVGAWVARYLGPTEFGELAYAVVYINFFQAIVNLGTDGIVVRDIVKEPDLKHEILGTTLWMRLATGFFFWIFSILVITDLKNLNAPFIYVILGSIIFFQAFDTIDLWFQSQNKSKKTAWSKLFAHTLSNLFKVVLILIKAKIYIFAIAIALDGILTAVGLIFNYKRNKTELAWKFKLSRAKNILAESWPYIISGIATMLYMRIDQFMIKSYLGVQQLGIYAVAIPLSQVWYVLPMTLTTCLAPYISNQKLIGEKEYHNSLLIIFRCFGAIAIIISISVFLISDEIVSVLYGPTYSQSAKILAIHIFTNIFVFQNLAQYLWIVNEGKGLNQTYQTVLGALTALICNFLLIPKFGLVGSAYSSVIAYAVSGVISNLILSKNILLMQLGIKPKVKSY